MMDCSHNTYTGSPTDTTTTTSRISVEAIVQEISPDLMFDQDEGRLIFQSKCFTNARAGNDAVTLFLLHDIHQYFYTYGTGFLNRHRVQVALIPPSVPTPKLSVEYKEIEASLPDIADMVGLTPISSVTGLYRTS